MHRETPFARVPTAHGFLWTAGIEDTFICRPHHRTGRVLDEYALTEHYDRWADDLRLLAELGIGAARYGVPWYRIETGPGRFDWEWTDRVLDTLVNTHHIEPIVDLMHYGTPAWLEGAFDHPDYPQRVADYAAAFAERYRDLCAWYTPLNEPRVNAWYAGQIGWWPPYFRSARGFARVLTQLARGICLTQRAVAAAQPQAVFVHVDATDLYLPADASDTQLAAEAAQRQALVFLALDLVTGRVEGGHALAPWLARHGVGEDALAWFGDHAVRPDVIGYNMYPMYSRKIVTRTASGSIRVRIKPCWDETLEALTHLYAERYAPIPLMVTETAATGTSERRRRWIEASVAVVARARRDGLPVVGYTYWPLFSLVGWAYQAGAKSVDDYLIHMGLWDLRRGETGLERVPTSAVEAYRSVVAGGVPEVVSGGFVSS